MIIIYYRYYNKKEARWKDAEMTFNLLGKALRFIYSFKNKDNRYLDGYVCYDRFYESSIEYAFRQMSIF